MDPGDVIDLDVTGVAHGGVFVGRHGAGAGDDRGGRVVFVPDAIPGERVRVRLTDLGHAAFWRGEVLDVIKGSPHRRTHVWRQADIDVAPENRPGGADFGHIDLSHQRELKTQVVRDSLVRIGGLDLPVTMAAASVPDAGADTPDGTGWRTRVSLHVDDDGRIGPFAARSHRVVTVDDLPLATPAIAAAAAALTAAAPGRIDLVEPADGRVRVIDRPDAPRAPARRDRGRGARPRPTRAHAAREVVTQRVAGRDFRVDAGGFWQVHRFAAHTLATTVAAALAGRLDPDARHLDLYGGVGLFAATLAGAGAPARVTSVDSVARASAHARANLADLPGARAETGRVDQWLTRYRSEASARDRAELTRGVVVVDPPRAGAGRAVVASIVALTPATVVYVACDPVALARDLGIFARAGYTTPRVDAFDLFPNSHHVEAVAVLSPSGTLRP